MSFLHFKKNITLSKVSPKKPFREIGRNAYVDWIVIIFISFITALVLGGAAVMLYFKITQGGLGDVSDTNVHASKTLKKNDLMGVINMYNKKVEKSDEAKKGYSETTDPSL